MWRILVSVVFSVLLAGLVGAAPQALAQQEGKEQEQAAAEFKRLYERFGQAHDPEEQISSAEGILKLESGLRQWPFQQPRETVRAQILSNLGLAYAEWAGGDRAENMERAIDAFQRALRALTRPEQAAKQWTSLQHNLGWAYRDRVRGDRADNMEKAIAAFKSVLTPSTRELFPQQWASTQHSLGTAYWERIHGNRADNVEKAIASFEAALTIRTWEALPSDWADTQNQLGMAYWRRDRGERVDNLEKAIAAYEAALTVATREALPHEWAGTQHNLGVAYQHRVRGDRANNVEKAIAAYEAALTVRTREALPRDWAMTQNSLGVAYQHRVQGDRADNLEMAIAALEKSLTYDWGGRAGTLNNLGDAFSVRIRGDRADNLEKAIAAFEQALTIFTHDDSSPNRASNWAYTQNKLGIAFSDRIVGDRVHNLEKSVAAFEAALTVRTREALPRGHLETAKLLGHAHLAARKWQEAGMAYANAREAFLILFGQGLNELEARDLISEAGPLFAEAAFAAEQRGESENALALASEGKARLMAVALKLQALDLPANKRRRLDELRAAIRTADRAVEAAQGTERAREVEKLSNLRQELLRIVKDADTFKSRPGSALDQARTIIAGGGALAVPIVTKVGGKILIVTSRTDQSLAALDLPELTTERLHALIRGDGNDSKTGWLRAYNINYLRNAERNRRWSDWLAAVDNLGPELWHLFGARLNAALNERGVERGARVVWLPSGALGILPLGLAQDPFTKRRLADDYEISYALSLEGLSTAQSQIAKTLPASLAVIVNPTGDLAGTEKEGKLVASHFPAKARTVLERTAATPDAVLAALKGKTHWHFASHGSFFWDDARQSALLMHGHVPLSVGRLLNTDGLGHPRLVVLSACETGLYDIDRSPDEFIGLPGTFMALGAAGVLGTLWPVSDAATALLIAKFYELHMGEGLAPPTALSRAQAWLRQASNTVLQAYARGAAQQGRLESRHIAEIEQELSDEGLTRSRNIVAVEWIAPNPKRTTSEPTSDKATRLARPYAHPYFWAGFVYTGL